MTATDIWMLIAGLGLFLYGMFHLEDSMKQMEGRSFKLFLQKNTKINLKPYLVEQLLLPCCRAVLLST